MIIPTPPVGSWTLDLSRTAETRCRQQSTEAGRFARKAHRTRLYLYAFAAIALLVALVALVIANTGHVKVSWVVGSSSVSLVWLVIFSAILGVLLGMVLGALFHWRTRTPRS